jgi:hypothetical protein
MNGFRITNDDGSASGRGSAAFAPGTLPNRKATACAETLSRLLMNQELTSISAGYGASTTRLSAHIRYLELKWGWTFKKRKKVHMRGNRRLARITAYRLELSVILAGMYDGAYEWCVAVQAARRELRAKAGNTRLRHDDRHRGHPHR